MLHKRANRLSIQGCNLLANHGPGNSVNLCQPHTFGLTDFRNGFVSTRVPYVKGPCYLWPGLCGGEGCSVAHNPHYIVPPAHLVFAPNAHICYNGTSCDNNILRKDMQIPRDVETGSSSYFFQHDNLNMKTKDKSDGLYDFNNNYNNNNNVSEPCTPSKVVPRRPKVIVLKNDRIRSENEAEDTWTNTKSNTILKHERNTDNTVQKMEIVPVSDSNINNKTESVSLSREIEKKISMKSISPVTPDHTAQNDSNSLLPDSTSAMEVETSDILKPKRQGRKNFDCSMKRKRYNTRSETTPQQHIFNKDFVTSGSVGEWLKEEASIQQRGRNRTKLNRLLANEHERRRVAQLNLGYQKLRKAIPGYQCDTKLPKIKILRYAIAYIEKLGILLGNEKSQQDVMDDGNNNVTPLK